MNQGYKIRLYKEGDKSDIVKALLLLQEREYELSPSTRQSQTLELSIRCLDEILNETEQNNGAIIVLRNHAQDFVGFVSYHFEQNKMCFEESGEYVFISNIFVMPDYRGRSYGKVLIDAACEKINREGFEGVVRVCALANNQEAVSLYNKSGFSPYEVIFEKEVK